MDEESDTRSEGSDIDVDSDHDSLLEEGNLEEIEFEEVGNAVDDDWVRGFFADDDDEDFPGYFDFNWTTDNFNPRNHKDFTLNGGSTFQHPEEAQPNHYFDLFWDDGMWDHLVTETNRYADQQRTANPPPPFAPRWIPVDKASMKAFIGLIFCMGILRLPCRNDYWRVSKRMFRTSFNKIMSRDRFNLIWRYLHLQDNAAPQLETPDRLIKLRWYLDYLNNKFSSLYTPYGNFTIDESMVKFKGRLKFRQYLPNKPTKWGIKIWVLAESDTGYVHKFQVYTGKEGNQEKGLSHRVVTDLVQHLHHTQARVYMDNFYTGTTLLTDLAMRGVNACGTVRANRKGLPPALLPKNLNLSKHEYKIAQKDELTCTTWIDTKPVMVLSNFHDPTKLGTVNRRSGNARQARVQVPQLLADYQTYMKGVDLADQMIGYHLINHRSRKYWRRLFFHCMMATANNAYIIAKDSNPDYAQKEWPTLKDFLEDLADGLIGDTKAGKDAPILHDVQPARRHDMERLFEKERVCHECRLRSRPGQRNGTSRFGCVQCNVPVHQQCFPAHITRANNL